LFSGANASYIPYDSAVPEILAYMYLCISRFGGSAVGLESSGTYQLPIRRTVQLKCHKRYSGCGNSTIHMYFVGEFFLAKCLSHTFPISCQGKMIYCRLQTIGLHLIGVDFHRIKSDIMFIVSGAARSYDIIFLEASRIFKSLFS